MVVEGAVWVRTNLGGLFFQLRVVELDGRQMFSLVEGCNRCVVDGYVMCVDG